MWGWVADGGRRFCRRPPELLCVCFFQHRYLRLCPLSSFGEGFFHASFLFFNFIFLTSHCLSGPLLTRTGSVIAFATTSRTNRNYLAHKQGTQFPLSPTSRTGWLVMVNQIWRTVRPRTLSSPDRALCV